MRFRTYCTVLCLSLGLMMPVSSPMAASVSMNEDFRQALSVTFKQMISSYQRGEKAPLNGDILDTANPAVADFFNFDSSIVHREKGATSPDQSIALRFYKDAVLDGQKTSACLMSFNSRNPNFLSGYESTRLFTKAETTYYLAAHEFGHCAALHQASLGNMKAIAVGEDHELFADQYALAFFLSQSQENTAKKIIAFNRTSVSESDFHYHPEELEAFFDAFPKPGSKELSKLQNTYDLVALTIKVAAKAKFSSQATASSSN